MMTTLMEDLLQEVLSAVGTGPVANPDQALFWLQQARRIGTHEQGRQGIRLWVEAFYGAVEDTDKAAPVLLKFFEMVMLDPSPTEEHRFSLAEAVINELTTSPAWGKQPKVVLAVLYFIEAWMVQWDSQEVGGFFVGLFQAMEKEHPRNFDTLLRAHAHPAARHNLLPICENLMNQRAREHSPRPFGFWLSGQSRDRAS